MVPPIIIYLLNLEENESDYIVTFMLNLLEAVSDNQLVPSLIGRIILNSLYTQIQDGEIIWLPKHQD